MQRPIKFRAWSKSKNEMFADVFDIPNCESWFNTTDVDIMQYTGLLDRNGVEIYEGDIVRTYHPFSRFDYNDEKDFVDGEWVCVWEAPALIFKPTDGRTGIVMTRLGGDLSEVIGNIYENPELLNNKENK